ncbi:MAG: TolC family protein [Candidatus Kapabacteria bacterium]|jgi:outer membrane protein|nr:TolC family protein [Candidatus Kapabacteria bacterium]
MKKINIILILLLTIPSVLSAEKDLTLADALKIGLENNFQIQIAEKTTDIAANNNSWADAGRYPTIDLQSSYNFSDANDPNAMLNFSIPGVDPSTLPLRTESQASSLSTSIGLNWMVFNGFAIYISKSSLSALHSMSRGNEAIVVENTIQAIVLAYYESLLEKEKLDVLRRLTGLSRDKYDYAQSKQQIGTSVTFDVLQFKNAFLRDSANYLMQEINYKNAVRGLNLLLAVDQFTEFNPTDKFEFIQQDYELVDLEQKLTENNKTLKNQYINTTLAENSIDMAKSRMYPSLALSTGYNYNDSKYQVSGEDASPSWKRNFYAGLSLNFNLYNGGRTSSDIQNTLVELEISNLRIDEMKLRLKNQLRTFYELYTTKRQLLNVSQAAYESTKLNMTIAGDKFKSGAINSFNYRDIQIAYLNAAFDRLQAVYNLIDTHTELMRITGGVISEY